MNDGQEGGGIGGLAGLAPTFEPPRQGAGPTEGWSLSALGVLAAQIS